MSNWITEGQNRVSLNRSWKQERERKSLVSRNRTFRGFFSFEPEKSIERVTIFFLPRNDFFFRNARSLQNEFFEELCDAERTVERQKVGSESLELEFECRRGWKISSWSVSWLLGFFLLMAAAFRSTYIFCNPSHINKEAQFLLFPL